MLYDNDILSIVDIFTTLSGFFSFRMHVSTVDASL